jgi:phosphoglucosamine mutase
MDCAHGAASEVATQLVERLNIPAVLLHAAPDGTNANEFCGSEHVRRHPEQIATLLRQRGWSVAVAFDGDADRALFVDQNGKVYNGDAMLAMLALCLKEEGCLPFNAVVTTPARNTGFRDHLRRHNIFVRETQRSGDKYVVEMMEQEGYVLGGEQVGHTILLDETHVTGDGVRTALLILQHLAQRPGASLDNLMGGMRCYPQILGGATIPRVAHNVNPDDIPGMAELKQAAWTSLIGLLRLEVRFASTEPLLRVMLESDDTVSTLHELAWWARRIGRHAQKGLGFTGYPMEVIDCSGGGIICE